MHELSIATALVEQIDEIADTNQVQRISEVELEIGVLRQVFPELMETAFREAAVGSTAEDAKLIINYTPAKARCRLCRTEFEPEIDNYICEKCHLADVDIIEGNDIILKSVVTLSEIKAKEPS